MNIQNCSHFISIFPYMYDLKIDLRVSRVGRGSLNTFFLLVGVISQRLGIVRKYELHTWRVQYTESCMLCLGRMNCSPKGIYIYILWGMF